MLATRVAHAIPSLRWYQADRLPQRLDLPGPAPYYWQAYTTVTGKLSSTTLVLLRIVFSVSAPEAITSSLHRLSIWDALVLAAVHAVVLGYLRC